MPPLLLLLAACGPCPTFDDMVVEDVDGTASSEVVEAAQAALDAFAAWTGDEGVCVPGIDLVDDVAEPLLLEEGYATAGKYRGKRRTIRVSTQWPSIVGASTLHELCHATDVLEGHVDAVAWPEVADRTVYAGNQAPREDFALACQAGAPDVVLDTALADRCGAAPLYDDADRYLAEVVFPGAPRMDLADEPVPLATSRRAWDTVATGAELLDAAPYDGGVALLVLEEDAGEGRTLLVRTVDATLAQVGAEMVLETGLESASGEFVPADEGLVFNVVTMRTADGQWSWGREVAAVEPATGWRWTVPTEDAIDIAAVSGEVLYAWHPAWYLHAWTLVGREFGVTQPPLVGDPLAMWPVPGGVGVADLAGIHVYDAETDTWTTQALSPRLVTAFSDLGGGRAVVVSGGVRLLYEDGAWAFLGDPCAESVADPWYVGDVVPVEGDRLLGLELGPAWEDADGDGAPERWAVEMAMGE